MTKTLLILSVFLFSLTGMAETCETLRSSALAQNKSVNIVLVPSNFEGDLKLFKKEAKKIVEKFESYKPFSKDNKFINFFLSTKEAKKNSFCKYGCSGIDRLLCCDRGDAKKLAKVCDNSKERQILVVHNDTKYGGAGYINDNIATTSINRSAPKVAVHEIGHSLFDLADEYTISTGTRGLRNCAKSDCQEWKDLIDIDFKGAECTPNGCAGGEYFTCGETIMKKLSLKFGPNNERLACCKYKEITGQYPSFCSPYQKAGIGLESFCSSKSLSIPSDFGEDEVEYFDPDSKKSGFYKIKH
tara:strand:+ start:89421 stop:90320 length:900 start_codon:yes stop_codon:yes gene_type:complete